MWWGLGRWVIAEAMTPDLIHLLRTHYATLGDWEYAPLTVALLEAAGRAVCWMKEKEALVVMPTLASPRLLGIAPCHVCTEPRAKSCTPAAAHACRACLNESLVTAERGVCACGRAGDRRATKRIRRLFRTPRSASGGPFHRSPPSALLR